MLIHLQSFPSFFAFNQLIITPKEENGDHSMSSGLKDAKLVWKTQQEEVLY